LFSAGSLLGERQLGVDVPRTFKQLDVGPVLNAEPQSPGCLSAGAIREIPTRPRMYPYVPTVASIPSRTSDVCSRMLEPGSGISFQLTGGQGAALLTKHPTYREDARLERNFEEYTKENYDYWVAFARERGHPNIELILHRLDPERSYNRFIMAIGIIIKGEVKPNLSSVIKQLLRL